MDRYSLLSDNLIIIITEIIKNDKLCKLIDDNSPAPLDNNNYVGNLLGSKIFPYSFNPDITLEKCTQLRVYYPYGDIKNRVIENTTIYFDIIIHKDLYLINIDDKMYIRDLLIMTELINTFNNISLSTVGKLVFSNFSNLAVNNEFNCLRLYTKMMTIGL